MDADGNPIDTPKNNVTIGDDTVITNIEDNSEE